MGIGLVDVRDVAKAHYLAAFSKNANLLLLLFSSLLRCPPDGSMNYQFTPVDSLSCCKVSPFGLSPTLLLAFQFLTRLPRCSLSSVLHLVCTLPRLLVHMVALPVNFYHTITNAPPALRSCNQYISIT